MANEKTQYELNFSLRDSQKGSELLHKLGLIKNLSYSDVFELDLDDSQEEILVEELQNLDIEFEIANIFI